MQEDVEAKVVQWLSEAIARPTANNRPLVTLSYAQSLDGSLSRRRGKPLRLSSPETMRMTHHLRALHDAILVGIGTVLADNPRLTVRLVEGKQPQPIILDSHLRIPSTAALLNSPPRMPWIATTETDTHPRWDELKSRGAKLLFFERDEHGYIPWVELFGTLYQLEIRSLIVEGGTAVITSLFEARLAEMAVITISPVFIGGLPVLEKPLMPNVHGNYPRFEPFQSGILGGDLVVWGDLRY